MKKLVILVGIFIVIFTQAGGNAAQDSEAQICTVAASTNVNIRTEPRTSSAVLDVLTARQTRTVTGQTTATDRSIWWQLEAGGWIAQDDVVSSGNCTFEEVHSTQSNSLEEAAKLNNLATQAYHQEQYADALDYYEQALVIVRDLDARENEGTLLNNIGNVYQAQGQYGQALDSYQQALTITREVGNRAVERTTLSNIGNMYYHQKQYAQALDYFQQALPITREMGDQAQEGTTLSNIASMYYHQGRYAQALDYFQQALPIQREVGNPAQEGTTLNNIGAAYKAQGQYGQALDSFQQALTIHREVGNPAEEGTTLSNIGNMYDHQGKYEEALDYYQQALVITRKVGDKEGVGTTLNNIGAVYQSLGQYGQSLDYYQQALAIAREVGNRPGESATLSNIGGMYRDVGQYGQALDYYQQAFIITREVSDWAGEAATLNNIGLIYDNQGQYEEALDYYQQALTIYHEMGEREVEGNTLNNIGLAYNNKGQYGEALDYYQQALAIARQTGEREAEGITLDNIGFVFQAQGQYGEALDYYQQALAIARQIGERASEGDALSNIGAVYDLQDRSDQALNYYKQAVDVQESLLQKAALDQSISSLAGSNGNIILRARVPQLLIQKNDFASALEYAERGRSILIRDELRNQPIDFRTNLSDQSLLTQEQQFRLQVLDAQNLVNSLNQDLGATNQAKQDAQTALDAAHNALDRHLERMQLQGGFLTRQLALGVASLPEIQATLSDDTTLLVYGEGYVLLVTAIDVRGVTFAATNAQIDEAVRRWAADRRANADTTLHQLYDLVFAPVADMVTTSNLIISPDGSLNYVPFAALQAPDGSFLIDHYTISMTPSATALVLLNNRQPVSEANSPALVLAQRDAPDLPRLRTAQTEATSIAAKLGVTALTDATETNLRYGSTGAAVIHISAHAELDRFAPLFSTIYLGKDDQNDGRVEVREIYQLDLSQGTKLVILSGCETASGDTGEDFGMLSRAFLAAGAEKVVASLWSVDDAATADLLTTFIAARETSHNDAQALQTAMMATRKNHPDPYFWASFVLVGLP